MNVIRLLFENLGLKLVALLLGIVVYLHVYTDRTASMVVSFPLQIDDLADSLTIAGTPPPPVLAELRGTGKQLIRLRLTEPRLKVSLARVGAGRFQRAVTVEDLPLMASDRLEVVRLIGPTILDVEVDRLLVRVLPVAARVTGVPNPAFAWNGDVLLDPAEVSVRGPRRSIVEIDSIRLAPVRLDAKRDTARAIVGPDSLPPGCTIDPTLVRVRVPLARRAH